MAQSKITDEEVLATLFGYKAPVSLEEIAVSTGCVNHENNGDRYTSKALGIIPSLKGLVEKKFVNEIEICDPDRFYSTKEVRYAISEKGRNALKEFYTPN